VTAWDWPNQQVVRADESGPGVDTPPVIEPNESRWLLSVTETAPPTVNGRVVFETGDQANPGTMWVTLVDTAGDDQTERALRLVTGSVLHLESTTSGLWQEYVCRTTPTLDGGLLTLVDPIHWDSTGLLVDGETVAITGYQLQAGSLPEIDPQD